MSSERHLVLARRSASEIGNWAEEFAQFAGPNYALEICESWLISPEIFTQQEKNRVQWLTEGYKSVIAFGLGMGAALPPKTNGSIITLAPASEQIPPLCKALKLIAASDKIAKSLRNSYPYHRVKVCAPGFNEIQTDQARPDFETLKVCIFEDTISNETLAKIKSACSKRGIEAEFLGSKQLEECNVILYLPESQNFPARLLKELIKQKVVLLPQSVAVELGLQPQKDCLVIEPGDALIGSIVSALQLPLTLESVGLAARATVLNNYDFEAHYKKLLALVSS